MHDLICNLCASSSPEEGIKLSPRYVELLVSIKDFNYKNIYNNKRLDVYKKYSDLILYSIFKVLRGLYEKELTWRRIWRMKEQYPVLSVYFLNWLLKYSDLREPLRDVKFKKRDGIADMKGLSNKIIYSLDQEDEYFKAIIDFMSGMTDLFAVKIFNEVTSF